MPVIFEGCFIPLSHRFVVRHLFQTVGHAFVVYSSSRAVAVGVFSARDVREALDFNMNYFIRHIRDFANVLVVGDISDRHVKPGDGNIKEVAGVHIFNTFSSHDGVIVGQFSTGNYLCYACC